MSTILVIDSDPSTRSVLEHCLAKEGFETFIAGTGTDGLNRYVEISPDLVLLDILLPDIDGLTILEELLEENENIKVIMMALQPDMETTVKAMKMGAFDYIAKPVDAADLLSIIRKAVSMADIEQKSAGRSAITAKDYKAGDIIGSGKKMREIFKMVGVITQSRTSVLIEGESGTGKELIAKVIHHHTSPHEPFVAVNCSAIVETLLESELFGHEKGSFTSAFNRQLGKFELARYGTLFLDEISEMSINLQAKLLRVLQEMEFERVGGKDKIQVHSRIITATNKDLRKLVRQGKFRADLFYRLNIVSIKLPALRDRQDDIPRLVNHLLAKINGELHRHIIGVSEEVLEAFCLYNWPGNVRELENLLVRASVMAKGRILDKSDFKELFTESELDLSKDPWSERDDFFEGLLTLDNVEERYIKKILKREKGKNKGELCDILGISRPTFERKLEKYAILFDRDGSDRGRSDEIIEEELKQ